MTTTKHVVFWYSDSESERIPVVNGKLGDAIYGIRDAEWRQRFSDAIEAAVAEGCSGVMLADSVKEYWCEING